MLHCNGCQDIRWMGGLLHYIPGLYVFYVTGSLSLAGLPYWSGYYCKSAAWFAATTTNDMVAALQLILLGTTALTYVYLLRAGYLIFFGPKNGHRSIYRVRYQSLMSTAALWLLGIWAAYSGALWSHMCATTLMATHQTLLAVYSVSAQLTHAIAPLAWQHLSLVYVCSAVGLYIIALRLPQNSARPLYSFFMIYCSFALVLVIYVCL